MEYIYLQGRELVPQGNQTSFQAEPEDKREKLRQGNYNLVGQLFS